MGAVRMRVSVVPGEQAHFAQAEKGRAAEGKFDQLGR